MANLSNINNKFLVTTGGNVLIGQTSAVGSSIFQVTGNATFAGYVTLSSALPLLYLTNTTASTGKNWRLSSATNGKFFIAQEGVVDAFTLDHTSGNATFAGNVLVGSGTIDNPQSWGKILQVQNSGSNGAALSIKDSNNEWNLATYQNYFYISDGIEERIIIDSSGNVGIGTTSPSYRLTAYGSSADSEIVASFGSANDQNEYTAIGLSGFIAINGATKAGLALKRTSTYGTGELHFLNNNTTDNSDMTLSDSKMVILGNGNVGIGTNSPKTNLEVIGGLNVSTNTTSATTTTMRIGSYGASAQTYYGAKIIAHTNFTTTANTDLSFDLGGLGEVMRLYSSGSETRVGIGTTSPDCKLTVAGSGSGGVNPSTISSNTVATFRRTGGVSHNANISILAGTSGASVLNFGDRDNEDAGIITYTHDSGGSDTMAFTVGTSEKMRIINSGKVGIGTTSPAYKLVVSNGGASGIEFSPNATAGLNEILSYNRSTSVYENLRLSTYGFDIYTNNGGNSLAITNTGNVGIGTNSPGDAKLYVNGGTTLGGAVNTSAGAIRMFGDRKLPQANRFVKRNYNLTAAPGGSLYSIARQWHDTANWGNGNINVIMWGIYYGKNNFSKADFSCRYGYSGNGADVETNFNPGGLTAPSWTAATQVSGNIYYRDLQIFIPTYTQISFEIISPGLIQTYSISNTASNTVYLYPH